MSFVPKVVEYLSSALSFQVYRTVMLLSPPVHDIDRRQWSGRGFLALLVCWHVKCGEVDLELHE